MSAPAVPPLSEVLPTLAASMAATLTAGRRLRRAKIVYEDDDGNEGSIPVPLPPLATDADPTPDESEIDEVCAAITAALKRFTAGDWVKGHELVAQMNASGMDVDRHGGTFKRATASLRSRKLIESDNRGFRMKQDTS